MNHTYSRTHVFLNVNVHKKFNFIPECILSSCLRFEPLRPDDYKKLMLEWFERFCYVCVLLDTKSYTNK